MAGPNFEGLLVSSGRALRGHPPGCRCESCASFASHPRLRRVVVTGGGVPFALLNGDQGADGHAEGTPVDGYLDKLR